MLRESGSVQPAAACARCLRSPNTSGRRPFLRQSRILQIGVCVAYYFRQETKGRAQVFRDNRASRWDEVENLGALPR